MPGCVASASEKHVRSARSPELEGEIECRARPSAAGKTRTPPACYNSRYSLGLHRGVLASMKRTAGPGWRNGRRWGLKIPCPEEDVWVRLPPRAPTLLIESESVNAARTSVYLWCTLRLQENEWVLAPCVCQIGFQLFLPRAHPGRVMLLCNPHTLMAEKNGNPLDWNSD